MGFEVSKFFSFLLSSSSLFLSHLCHGTTASFLSAQPRAALLLSSTLSVAVAISALSFPHLRHSAAAVKMLPASTLPGQPLSAVQPSSRSCRSLPAPLRRVAVRDPAAAIDRSRCCPSSPVSRAAAAAVISRAAVAWLFTIRCLFSLSLLSIALNLDYEIFD